MLIAYVQEDKEAYWYWYNDLNLDLTKERKMVRINIPRANIPRYNWKIVDRTGVTEFERRLTDQFNKNGYKEGFNKLKHLK